jgi:carboxyl-terminal processing protease
MPIQKLKSNQRINLKVAATALLLLLGLIQIKWISIEIKKALATSEESSFGITSNMSDSVRKSESNITLTVDSILSVIQGYYVDKSRVSNQNLIEIAEKLLQQMPEVTYKKTKDGSIVAYRGEVESLPSTEKITYSNLLNWIVKAESFLTRVNKNIKAFAFSKSLLLTLDAHSAYLSPEDYLDLRQGTEGVFGGLGVLVGMRDSLLTVIKPIPYSPASRFGIKRRDKILTIDGHQTFGSNLDHLIEVMRGAPGTQVNLGLLREGAVAPETIMLKREVIQVESVASDVISLPKGQVLRMTIDSFSNRTASQVADAIRLFKLDRPGPKGIILDLRSNPGGLLDQAVGVVDQFIESGVIVATKGRREETEVATNGVHEVAIPMVVLINGDSASASEIVAGALQDHNRALIIGQKSFGKGSVQTVFELPGDSAVKVTIARYYTPKGRSIQSFGVVPDIKIVPVEKTTNNYNILSLNRYRSEAFLEQHLKNDDRATNLWSQSSFEGFYLADTRDEFSMDQEDKELEFSRFYFSKLFEKSSEAMYSERASNLAAGLAPEITSWLTAQSENVYQWLDEKFNVNWKDGNFNSHQLQFSASCQDKGLPGRTLKFHFSLGNRRMEPSGRVSVFLRGELGVEAEKLIGKIDSFTNISDQFSVTIPNQFQSGLSYFDIGVAVNGDPIESTIVRIPVNIEERGYSFLRALVKLDESKNIKLPNSLQSGETTNLIVSLTNDSIMPMKNVNVSLGNLTGLQTTLIDTKKIVDEIPPRGKIELLFPLKIGPKILTPKLEYGIQVDSPDLRQPWQSVFAVRSGIDKKPQQNAQRALAH